MSKEEEFSKLVEEIYDQIKTIKVRNGNDWTSLFKKATDLATPYMSSYPQLMRELMDKWYKSNPVTTTDAHAESPKSNGKKKEEKRESQLMVLTKVVPDELREVVGLVVACFNEMKCLIVTSAACMVDEMMDKPGKSTREIGLIYFQVDEHGVEDSFTKSNPLPPFSHRKVKGKMSDEEYYERRSNSCDVMTSLFKTFQADIKAAPEETFNIGLLGLNMKADIVVHFVSYWVAMAKRLFDGLNNHLNKTLEMMVNENKCTQEQVGRVRPLVQTVIEGREGNYEYDPKYFEQNPLSMFDEKYVREIFDKIIVDKIKLFENEQKSVKEKAARAAALVAKEDKKTAQKKVKKQEEKPVAASKTTTTTTIGMKAKKPKEEVVAPKKEKKKVKKEEEEEEQPKKKKAVDKKQPSKEAAKKEKKSIIKKEEEEEEEKKTTTPSVHSESDEEEEGEKEGEEEADFDNEDEEEEEELSSAKVSGQKRK